MRALAVLTALVQEAAVVRYAGVLVKERRAAALRVAMGRVAAKQAETTGDVTSGDVTSGGVTSGGVV